MYTGTGLQSDTVFNRRGLRPAFFEQNGGPTCTLEFQKAYHSIATSRLQSASLAPS